MGWGVALILSTTQADEVAHQPFHSAPDNGVGDLSKATSKAAHSHGADPK